MHPEVAEIRSKLASSPWPKYLKSLKISGLRGWGGTEVRFPFPVTVVVGENGSGKSTVLKCAASAYTNTLGASYSVATFFPDTPWDRHRDAVITYEIREGNRDRTVAIRKPRERWRLPDRPDRNVVWQDVARTLPIEATVGYARIAKRTAIEVGAEALNPDFQAYYGSILGRPYDAARFARADADTTRAVGVVRWSGAEYSQFHQGAGEDATLDLMLLLQNVPQTSLILIDEAEASLHPRAQRRLIHFLLWLARSKQIQVIISTHSPYVIDELPPDARLFLSRGSGGIEAMYGVSSQYALNRMDDIAAPELYVFCEDDLAAIMVNEIVRAAGLDPARIRAMAVGPGDAVRALGRLSAASRLPVRSLAVVDADQSVGQGTVRLPGAEAPEKQVFKDILARAVPILATRLELTEAPVRDALLQTTALRDHHDWPAHAARLLGNQTSMFLWQTMVQVWVKHGIATPDFVAFRDSIAAALAAAVA